MSIDLTGLGSPGQGSLRSIEGPAYQGSGISVQLLEVPISSPSYEVPQTIQGAQYPEQQVVYGPGGGVIPSWDPNYSYYAGLQENQSSQSIEGQKIESFQSQAPFTPGVFGWEEIGRLFANPTVLGDMSGGGLNPMAAAGITSRQGLEALESSPQARSDYLGKQSLVVGAGLAGAAATPTLGPAAASYGKYILGMSAITGGILPATAAIGSTPWAEAQVSQRESRGLSSAESEWNKYTNLDQYKLDLLAQKDSYINSQLAFYDEQAKLGTLSVSRDSYKSSVEDAYNKFINSSLGSVKPSLRWNDKVYTDKSEFIRDYTSSLGTNRTQLSKEPGFLGAMGRGIQSIWDPFFEKVDIVGNALGPFGQLGAGVIHWSLPYSDMAKDYNKYGSGALYELIPGVGPTFGKAAVTWNDIGDFERGTLIAGGVAPLVLPGLFQGASYIGGKVGTAVFSRLPGPMQTLATNIAGSRGVSLANRFVVQPSLKVVASPYTIPEALGGQIVKGTGALAYATGAGLARAGSYVGSRVGPAFEMAYGRPNIFGATSPGFQAGENLVGLFKGKASNLDPFKPAYSPEYQVTGRSWLREPLKNRIYNEEGNVWTKPYIESKIELFHPEKGIMGTLTYNNMGNQLNVQYLNTLPGFERLGVATRMGKALLDISSTTGLPINTGGFTSEGSPWMQRMFPKGQVDLVKGPLEGALPKVVRPSPSFLKEALSGARPFGSMKGLYQEPIVPSGSSSGSGSSRAQGPLLEDVFGPQVGKAKQTPGNTNISFGGEKPVTVGGGGSEPPIRPPAPEIGPSVPDDFNSRLMATQGQFAETSFVPNRLGNFSQEQINALNKLAQEGKVVFERGEPIGYKGVGNRVEPFKSDAEAIFFRPQGTTSRIEALGPKELRALQKLSNDNKVVYADGKPVSYKDPSGAFIELTSAERSFLSNEASIAQLKSAVTSKTVRLNSEGRLVGFETPSGFKPANTLQKELFGGYRGPVSGGEPLNFTKPIPVYSEGQIKGQGAVFTSPFLKPNTYAPTNLVSSGSGGEFLGNSLREFLIKKANVTGSPFMRLDTGEQPWFMNMKGESGPSRGSFAVQGPIPEVEGSGDLFGGRGSARPAAPTVTGGGGSGVATLVRTPSIIDARIRFEYDPLTGMLRPIYPGQPVIRPLTIRPSSPVTEFPAEPSPIPPVIPDEFTSPQPVSIPSPYEEPFTTPSPTPIPPPRVQEEPIPIPYVIPQPVGTSSPVPQPVPQLSRVTTLTPIPPPVTTITRLNIPPIGPPIVPIIPLLSGLGGLGGGGGGPAHPSYPGNRGIWKFAGIGIYAPNPLPWGKKSIGGWQGRKNIIYGSKIPNEPVVKKARQSGGRSLYSSSSLKKAVTSI